MTQEKFTPGPWTVGSYDKAGQRLVEGKHFTIATCWHHAVGSIEKEMEANAHLIAAAPEMYEALQILLDVAQGSRKLSAANLKVAISMAGDAARCAISKAEGEKK